MKQENYPGIRIAVAPEDLGMEEMLARVEDGAWDAAICNSVHLEVERAYGRKISAAFALGDENIGWVVRRTNPRLLQALNTSSGNTLVLKLPDGADTDVLPRQRTESSGGEAE